MAQREARQFNPYGRADYFRIAGDSPGTPRLASPALDSCLGLA
jgi:hypothetical protein